MVLYSTATGSPRGLPCKYHIINSIPLSILLTIIPHITTSANVPHIIKWANLGALDLLVWWEDLPLECWTDKLRSKSTLVKVKVNSQGQQSLLTSTRRVHLATCQVPPKSISLNPASTIWVALVTRRVHQMYRKSKFVQTKTLILHCTHLKLRNGQTLPWLVDSAKGLDDFHQSFSMGSKVPNFISNLP